MKLKTRDMILISMFAALTAVGAFLKIPMQPVPFTLQFLFCLYAGVFLGGKNGLYSQLLYIGIGLIGIPIFTYGGGFTYIFNPTFGYLVGFALCSYIVGKYTERVEKVNFINIFLPGVLGLAVVYLLGVGHMYMIYNLYLGKAMSISKAIAVGFTPFLLQDLVKVGIVAFTAVYVVPVLRKTGLVNAHN